jgi:hypothetical protein
MIINGCFYGEERVHQAMDDLELAVSRMPLSSPLRPTFDFVIGYINAIEQEIEDKESRHDELDEANTTIANAVSAIEKATNESFHGLEEAVARLIELYQAKQQSLTELEAVRL